MSDSDYELDPDFKIENPVTWSGKTSSYHHNWHDTPNPQGEPKGFRKVWLLDAQWSDCPEEVEAQVKKMWREYENGNDRYVIKTNLINLIEDEKFVVVQYILEQCPEIERDELILIHWWW